MTYVFILLALILLLLFFLEYFIRFALGRNNAFDKKGAPSDSVFYRDKAKEIFKEGRELLESAECVHIKSFDGLKLSARLIDNKSSYYLISLHGFHGSINNNAPVVLGFNKLRVNILTPFMRAHGESEGKWITMGRDEEKDILSWINYIKERDKSAKIIIFGVSMGAATALMLTKEKEKSIQAFISDCSYSSLMEEYFVQAKEMFHMRKFIIYLINFYSKLRLGFDFNSVSPINAVKENTKPLLIIHGMNDKFVPTFMAEKIFKEAKGEKELILVEGAGHGESMFIKEDYLESILLFLKKNGINL